MSNYCSIRKYDVANGPGIRVSIFLSGCPHHCKGCFNQDTWDFNAGQPFTDETMNELLCSLAPSYISGITILGGEPCASQNQEVTARICERTKTCFQGKSVWVYTGYTLDSIPGAGDGGGSWADRILKYADVVVDGPFVEELKDISLVWRGSSNQRIYKNLGAAYVDCTDKF